MDDPIVPLHYGLPFARSTVSIGSERRGALVSGSASTESSKKRAPWIKPCVAIVVESE